MPYRTLLPGRLLSNQSGIRFLSCLIFRKPNEGSFRPFGPAGKKLRDHSPLPPNRTSNSTAGGAMTRPHKDNLDEASTPQSVALTGSNA
jgi:hypothetical protein